MKALDCVCANFLKYVVQIDHTCVLSIRTFYKD